MSFVSFETEHIRLAIVQILDQDSDYRHNEHILAGALDELGYRLSSDRLRSECSWLAEQGLITLERVGGSVWVASLTRRGQDVAAGRCRIPGIARLRPRD